MKSSQYLHGVSMDTNSHISSVTQKNSLLNGLIPPTQRLSETLSNASTSPNQKRLLSNCNHQIKRSQTIKFISFILCLTLILAFLFTITIQFSIKLVRKEELNLTNNNTKLDKSCSINSFFACVWLFNFLLFVICLSVHILIYQRRSQRNRTRTVFLREFGRIFDDEKCSPTNTLIDYLMKTCLLCLLWYLSSYFIFRSMSILNPSEIIILYSITITLRQVLGWIFLHEQFIGNKIIAHILALSALLLLAHSDGFRFNRYLLGLAMVTCSVAMKTTFDILISGFIKELTSFKLRIVMINVCLCGTCLLWPFVILFHATRFEPVEFIQFYSTIFLIALISALLFNILSISIPIKYTSIANIASLLFIIPGTSLIDRYYHHVKYSPLTISAILCSFVGILLSLIPKQWFQPGEAGKMKQALSLWNKDSNANANVGTTGTGNTTTGTSSAFEEIRAQRRIRNAFLYNEIKT